MNKFTEIFTEGIADFENVDTDYKDYEGYDDDDGYEDYDVTAEDLKKLISQLDKEDYNEAADMLLDLIDDLYDYDEDLGESDDEDELEESRKIRITKHTKKGVLRKAKRFRKKPKYKAAKRKKNKRKKKKHCGPGMSVNNDGRGCHRDKKIIGKKKRKSIF